MPFRSLTSRAEKVISAVDDYVKVDVDLLTGRQLLMNYLHSRQAG